MRIISFCLVGDENLEESGHWNFTTKSFTPNAFGYGSLKDLEEKYAGALTPEEMRIALPAPEEPSDEPPTPERLARQVARELADYQRVMGRPHPNPAALAARRQAENEQEFASYQAYQATRPYIRQPAELLAVLQKMEQHLRATKDADSHDEDGDFSYEIDFACLYSFLREAQRQGWLVHWSGMVV